MKKWSLQEIADKVMNEGLGYMVQEYLGASKIKDEELSKLWGECKQKMDEIEKILEPYMS
jgi:hypothetical protein